MVTYDANPTRRNDGKYEFSFKGLSTDTKPTGTWHNQGIANGSSFLEINTQAISFYDEEGETWD